MSIAIFISQYTNASTQGVTWSLDHAAPKVAVDAGVATAETGGRGNGSQWCGWGCMGRCGSNGGSDGAVVSRAMGEWPMQNYAFNYW